MREGRTTPSRRHLEDLLYPSSRKEDGDEGDFPALHVKKVSRASIYL